MPTLPQMKALKCEIKKAVLESGGYPNFTKLEYLDAIRHTLFNRLSNEQIRLINSKNIDVDSLIMKITADLTKEFL